MRFFASWWERVPARQVVPALVTVMAFGFGLGRTSEFLNFFLGRLGSYWT
jgi:hypothetical protein